MFDLLRTDFYRIFKSKVFYVLLGICFGLPLLTVLMVFGINKGGEALLGVDGDDFSLINGKLLISGIYGLSSNVGLILPIFLVILVGGDMSNGLLRNKILVGKSKIQIYFSHLIVVTIIALICITINAIVISLLTFWLIPYGSDLNYIEIRSLIFYYILGTLSFVFISSLIVMMTLNFNHIVFPILLIVLFGIGIMLLTQIINALDVEALLEMTNKIPKQLIPVIKNALYFIPINAGNSFAFSSSVINAEGKVESEGITILAFIIGTVSLIVFTFLATLGGAISFKNKELK